MRNCTKCGDGKPLTDFYKHPSSVDGRDTKCKECVKAAMTRNRNANIERIRVYDRARGARQAPEYLAEYRARKPNVYAAQSAVSSGLRDGKITKPVLCQYCGTYDKLHGHHRDYSRPLDVQWLCVPCHKQWHAANGEALNAASFLMAARDPIENYSDYMRRD